MATLKEVISAEDLKPMTPTQVKKAYTDLSVDYTKIVKHKLLNCPMCDVWMPADTMFYSDARYAVGKYPVCRKCLLSMVEQRKSDKEPSRETKESVQIVLQMLDLPYIDDFYESCIKGANDNLRERTRSSPFTTYVVCMKSLPQWSGKHWKDSQFGNDDMLGAQSSTRRPRKDIIKMFGNGYSTDDYLYLQDQYDDWRSRTQVDSKSQETYVMQICLQLLDIQKDRQAGKDVTSKLKALDTLMNAANLQPKQNVANASTDSLSLGQLIEKWENERPIPEPDPEFADVDNIGKYIRVFFAGHLCKALGIKNSYSQEYEEYMDKYTVRKPEYIEDGTSDIYNQLFGITE